MKHIILINKKCVLTFLLCSLLTVGLLTPPTFGGELSSKEILEMVEEQSFRASLMAVEAKATDDYYMAQQAFALATEAAGWVAEVSEIAHRMSNAELGRTAHDAASKIRVVIIHVQIAARQISDTNLDPEIIHAANFLVNSCELALRQFGGPAPR
ncbi:exported hypothetical protein [uncultured Desulfobacterium sp.]|uniref:Secreted protein n=1 Tax=uncultured Desulfobacterium sp. TaxID=201089 RepID=A0A445MTT2_9BACT|nr:exported hypothetical protein [uncultured Desulfobacterium sp.]